ncbi:hypothetical protein X801_09797, partial [Opisthorchis viverrini]
MWSPNEVEYLQQPQAEIISPMNAFTVLHLLCLTQISIVNSLERKLRLSETSTRRSTCAQFFCILLSKNDTFLSHFKRRQTQSGSPSEGVLYRGDAIIAINGETTRNLSHGEATEKIRSSGTELQMTIS